MRQIRSAFVVYKVINLPVAHYFVYKNCGLVYHGGQVWFLMNSCATWAHLSNRIFHEFHQYVLVLVFIILSLGRNSSALIQKLLAVFIKSLLDFVLLKKLDCAFWERIQFGDALHLLIFTDEGLMLQYFFDNLWRLLTLFFNFNIIVLLNNFSHVYFVTHYDFCFTHFAFFRLTSNKLSSRHHHEI